VFMIDRLTNYHIACLDFRNSAGPPILTWHMSNTQTSSFSMQIKFGGGTRRGIESALYAGTVIGTDMALSRLDPSDGTVQWTYGFACSIYQ
jgi:hypothetical protein